MKIEFLTKNYTAGEKLKDIVTKKIDRLDKFLESDTKIKVMLKSFNDVYSMELTIIADSAVLRAEVSSGNMYDNIDLALPKLEKQIIRYRSKLMSKSKKFSIKDIGSDLAAPAHAAEEQRRGVVRFKSYDLSPMTVEDAIDELELVGHSFYLFENKSTKKVNVVYRRNDGDYGVIEANT
jgi:putative sigma-54 modulation protein